MKPETKEFQHLLEVIDQLLGPNGCPWDHAQTLDSIWEDLLEEVYEVIEAIQDRNHANLQEELGDLFFLTLFISRLAKRDAQILTEHILADATEKFIRRHPHVFGKEEIQQVSEVIAQWERIKQEEKKERTSALDGISKTLPALSRCQKVVSAFTKKGFVSSLEPQTEQENIAEQIWKIVLSAKEKHIDSEAALLSWLRKKETDFRSLENIPK